MASTSKTPLADAAGLWLGSPVAREGVATPELVAALTDFVDNRYRGAASDLKRIHEFRFGLLSDERPLETLNDASRGPWDRQSLGQAASASATPDQGRLLFQLVRSLKPRRVLELGTNIGISAAYIATALRYVGSGGLTTLEASGVRLRLARSFLAELGIEDVDLVEGYFEEVLDPVLDRLGRVDVAFVDGHHQRDPTVAYFERIRSHMDAGGLMVFDDIRWSDGMREAWETIAGSPATAFPVDLGRTGLIVLA